jgi:hypothetical protein
MSVELLLGEDVAAVLMGGVHGKLVLQREMLLYGAAGAAQGQRGPMGAARRESGQMWDVNMGRKLTSQLKDTMVMAVKVATLAVCQWVDEGESVSLQECIAIDCAARGVHGRGFMLFWRPGHHSSPSALPRLHRASRCHDWPCQAHDPCLGLYLGLLQRVRDMRPDAKHSHAMNSRGAP